MSKAIFISREDIVRYTPISGNLDFDKLVQYIEIAQDIHIHELLGSRLYKKLQSDIIGSTLSGRYLELVTDHIKPTLCQYSLLEFLPFSQYTINNKGVFKHTSENANSLGKDDMHQMTEATRDTAQHYATRMVDHLCNFSSDFPEYLTNTLDELSPQRNVTFGGWEL